MKKNMYFEFNILLFILKYCLLELVLIILSIFFPVVLILSIPYFIVLIILIDEYRKQVVNLDPFTVERNINRSGGTDVSNYSSERLNKYYYINDITSYKKSIFFITLYGDIEYTRNEKTENNNKTSKINKVKILRSFKNEKEYLAFLDKKIQNKNQ